MNYYIPSLLREILSPIVNFAFQRFSTEQAILEITENLAIDNGEITCGLFLDLSKAFDTVNHQISINKLSKYRIR